MNLAVKFYQDDNNPQSLPDEWPSQVRELGESTELPEGEWTLMTLEEFEAHKAAHQAEYNTWKIAHSAPDMVTIVKNKILKAMDFGKNLMAEYGAKNILAGKSIADIKEITSRLATLQTLLTSGSLYCALDEMNNITADELISQETINEFKTKLQNYLGI